MSQDAPREIKPPEDKPVYIDINIPRYRLAQLSYLTRNQMNRDLAQGLGIKDGVPWKLIADDKGWLMKTQEVVPITDQAIKKTAAFALHMFATFIKETEGMSDAERLEKIPHIFRRRSPNQAPAGQPAPTNPADGQSGGAEESRGGDGGTERVEQPPVG